MPGQASEEAIDRALKVTRAVGWPHMVAQTKQSIAAAHDPALGLNRSVRLSDVVDALREEALRWRPSDPYANDAAAEHIERTFTGRASSSPKGSE